MIDQFGLENLTFAEEAFPTDIILFAAFYIGMLLCFTA